MSNSITINGNVVQLADVTPSADAANTKYLLIKGGTHIGQREKRQLAERGVKLYEYLGENVYLCYYEPSELKPIQDLDFVDAASVYSRDIKTSALLKQALGVNAGGAETASFDIEVVLHKGEGQADDIIDKIAESTGVDRSTISVEHNKLRLSCSADSISRIEELDAVRAIEKQVPKTLYNNVARGDLDIDTVVANKEPIPKSPYEGHGQVVAVSDTGFDIGSQTDTHPAFDGRVRALIPVGRPESKETNDFQGHGTHVAGSALGDGFSQTMGGKIRGAAAKAELVLQSLLDADGNLRTPANLWNLFLGPYREHAARIATNSWGPDWIGAGSRQVGYDSDAQNLDKFVWYNQDHVILFAAGNDGRERSATNAQIGSSSAAKNCIAVGATQSSRKLKGFAYDPNGVPGNPNAVASFSSRGPSREKRQKPDVVAPGVAILSAASRDPKAMQEAAGAAGSYGKSKDPLWMFSAGTSMATPLAAGCCALLREALDLHGGVTQPSAALVKALLINGAVDLGLPKNEQGFGRIDVVRSLTAIEKQGANAANGNTNGNGVHANGNAGSGFGFADIGYVSGKALEEEMTWSTEVPLPSTGGAEFKATLAYSDRAGEALQNKLSLTVRFSGGADGTTDVEKRGADGNGDLKENNVEQVVLKQGANGRYTKATITVRADRIARLDDTQPFAVVWGLY